MPAALRQGEPAGKEAELSSASKPIGKVREEAAWSYDFNEVGRRNVFVFL